MVGLSTSADILFLSVDTRLLFVNDLYAILFVREVCRGLNNILLSWTEQNDVQLQSAIHTCIFDVQATWSHETMTLLPIQRKAPLRFVCHPKETPNLGQARTCVLRHRGPALTVWLFESCTSRTWSWIETEKLEPGRTVEQLWSPTLHCQMKNWLWEGLVLRSHDFRRWSSSWFYTQETESRSGRLGQEPGGRSWTKRTWHKRSVVWIIGSTD